MKSKTKLQKKVVAQYALLPKLTQLQHNLVHQNCFRSHYTRTKNMVYCLECGHKWKEPGTLITAIIGADCPKCSKHLEKCKNYQPYMRINAYCAQITTRDDMQIVRMFFATKVLHKNHPANYSINEVMQHWINPDGRIVMLSRKCMGQSIYYDQWAEDPILTVSGNSERSTMRFNTHPDYILPGLRILPIIKRNGYKNTFHGFTPHALFSMILQSSEAETLLKTKQIPMLDYFSRGQSRVVKYWPSIRICIRNKYIIKDASMWFDYIVFLEYFRKDLNSPKYVCPDNLKEVHDFLLERKRKQESKIKREELLKTIASAERQYLKSKKKFLKLQFTKDNLCIQTFQSVIQVYDEGEILHHCVYHSNYHTKKNSILLSARINNVPVETIHVLTSPLKIEQSRGLQNKPSPYHNDIINLLQENLHQIKKYI